MHFDGDVGRDPIGIEIASLARAVAEATKALAELIDEEALDELRLEIIDESGGEGWLVKKYPRALLGRSQQILALRSRLHDAHLLGCVAPRQLERVLGRARQPRLEVGRIRHQHRHALVVDALRERVRLGGHEREHFLVDVGTILFEGTAIARPHAGEGKQRTLLLAVSRRASARWPASRPWARSTRTLARASAAAEMTASKTGW